MGLLIGGGTGAGKRGGFGRGGGWGSRTGIQDAYALRQLYEQLADPKYTDKTGIFDIMALTVIQKGLELSEAS